MALKKVFSYPPNRRSSKSYMKGSLLVSFKWTALHVPDLDLSIVIVENPEEKP